MSVGVGPSAMEPGDVIALVLGCGLPCVVRLVEDYFLLVQFSTSISCVALLTQSFTPVTSSSGERVGGCLGMGPFWSW
jgi:hypothetical protein